MVEFKSDDNSKAIKDQIREMKQRNERMRGEVERYRILAKKAEMKTNTVEIVKEVETAPIGLSKNDIETLAAQNVFLELEVRRLKEQAGETVDKNYNGTH